MANVGWNEVNEEEKERLKASFPVSLINDLIRYENGFVMPRIFAEKLEEKIYDFELRDDDIWIVTYPKCGTTWTQELVWMLINDMDVERSKVPQIVRIPFLEVESVYQLDFLDSLGLLPPDEKVREVIADPVQVLNNMKGRRVIMSHLPFEFLPPKLLDTCKVVYVARNPRDQAVSFYHHDMNVPCQGFVGTFDEFLWFYEKGLHVYGGYWNHLLNGWQHRDHENLKFLWFEDMKKDTKAVIDELCDFLQHTLTEDKKGQLLEHVKFDNMKNNPNANPSAKFKSNNAPPKKDFMRKGQVGDWKNYFDKERCEKWEKWIAENIKGTGLEEIEYFKFE